MERAVAVKKLHKMLGKKFCYRVDERAPSKDEREAAAALMPEAVAKKTDLSKQLEERRTALLAADEQYQNLTAEYAKARKECDRLTGIRYRDKISVGTDEGLFFRVAATGDSWEEVINKVNSRA